MTTAFACMSQMTGALMPPKRKAASASFKMDPDLLAYAKQLVPWLKGELLRELLPELAAQLEKDGEDLEHVDVSVTDYVDYLLRSPIHKHHAIVIAHIAKQHKRTPKPSAD